MADDGHRSTWGPPKGGWPSFDPPPGPTEAEVLAEARRLHDAECPCGKVIGPTSSWMEYARLSLETARG